MARSFNRLTLVGYLGRDPESTMLPSGDQVTGFTMATDEKKKDGSTATTWFHVSAFGKIGEVAVQYLTKGSYIYIDGSLVPREFTDRDGQQRHSLEVRARDMQMLDKAGDRGEISASALNPTTDAAPNPDVPF